MFSKIAIVTLFAGLVAGQATPVGEPSGNPITAPVNEIVPACKPFTITWQPTTPNSVSLLLLKGPPTNVVQFGEPIFIEMPNSGSFEWTPASNLPATSDNTGYGLQIIDDVTGQYQYSTQFGISKGEACESYVTPSPSSSRYGGGYPVSTPVSSSMGMSMEESSKVMTSTVKMTSTMITYTSVAYPTGSMPGNGTIVMPTGSMTVPSSLRPSASTSAPAEQTTNAAAGLQAGLGFVGAAAAAVAYLL